MNARQHQLSESPLAGAGPSLPRLSLYGGVKDNMAAPARPSRPLPTRRYTYCASDIQAERIRLDHQIHFETLTNAATLIEKQENDIMADRFPSIEDIEGGKSALSEHMPFPNVLNVF
jgi:hypothetical protein